MGYAFSQNNGIQLAGTQLHELEMTQYGLDPSASAVILRQFAVSEVSKDVELGLRVTYDKSFRIKILSKEGYEHAEVKLPVYIGKSGNEAVKFIRAQTYNLENGEIVVTPLEKENIFVEKMNDDFELVKFSLPAVKVGSVIEYSYQLESDFAFSFDELLFQYDLPCIHSEHRLSYPFVVEYKMVGYGLYSFKEAQKRYAETKPKINSEKMTFGWIFEHLPAFREEPFMPFPNNFKTKLKLEMDAYYPPVKEMIKYNESWESLSFKLLSHPDFKFKFGNTPKFNKYLKEEGLLLADEFERMVAVHALVRDKMNWNGKDQKYASYKPTKAWEKEGGNSADINLLLCAMLNAAELEVCPVLLSTKDFGTPGPKPIINNFNYVVASVMIQGERYLLDATHPYYPHSVLPYKLLNDWGRLISKKDTGWVNLKKGQKEVYSTQVNYSLNSEGMLSGNYEIIQEGYEAATKRELIKSSSALHYREELSNEMELFQLANFEVFESENLEKPLRTTFQLLVERST